jgi:LysM repeat protein
MWLTFNGEKEKLQIPILPEVFSVKDGSNNTSINVNGLGEITVIGDRPALEFSFSSFFPFNGATPPQLLKAKITEWKNSKQPVHFILTGFTVDLFCTIESFTTSENGGDVGTINYSITLKEYREVNIRTVTVATSTGTATVKPDTARVDNTAPLKTYTVKPGDCLWNIAKAYLGNGSRYTEIYNLNKAIIKNPNLIYSGQVLKMPAR